MIGMGLNPSFIFDALHDEAFLINSSWLRWPSAQKQEDLDLEKTLFSGEMTLL